MKYHVGSVLYRNPLLRYLLTSIMLLLSCSEGAAENWDWYQNVVYQESHDPGVVLLKDGREFQVIDWGSQYSNLDTWKAGQSVLLAYKSAIGAVIYAQDSGKSVPVWPVAGGKHPIDLMTTQCLEKAQSTSSMSDCYHAGYGRWDGELNRVYNALVASLVKNKTKEAVDVLKDAQREWLKFRDAQLKAITAISNRYGGTQSKVTASMSANDILIEQVHRLNDLLLLSFDGPDDV
ncbi:MAG: DUF1311 domain-containing protein [Methylococcus sp.]|nr:DUF1311 domain-containing protein [Methylococcus sp.]